MSDQPEPTDCPECGGWGYWLGHDPRGLNLGPLYPCERCRGTGVIDCTCPGDCPLPEHDRHLLPSTPHEPCETCHGEGEV